MLTTVFRPLHDRVVVRRIEAEVRPRVGLSFRTPPKKSQLKAKSLALALVPATKVATLTRLT